MLQGRLVPGRAMRFCGVAISVVFFRMLASTEAAPGALAALMCVCVCVRVICISMQILKR